MKKQLKNPVKSVQQLEGKLRLIWAQFTAQKCRELIITMPDRIEAVLKAKGNVTKY